MFLSLSQSLPEQSLAFLPAVQVPVLILPLCYTRGQRGAASFPALGRLSRILLGPQKLSAGVGTRSPCSRQGQVPQAGHRSLAFCSSRAGRTSSFPRAAAAAGLFGQQGTLRARWARHKRGACGVLGRTQLPAPRLNPFVLQRSTTRSTAPAAGTGPGCRSGRRARFPLVGFRPSAGHFHSSRFAPVGTGWSRPSSQKPGWGSSHFFLAESTESQFFPC